MSSYIYIYIYICIVSCLNVYYRCTNLFMLLYFQVVFKIAYMSRKPDKNPKTKKKLSLSLSRETKIQKLGFCAPAKKKNEDDF